MAAIGIAVERRNSDFMVDVFKMLGLEYAAANSGSTVLALQESIVNYGGNALPEFLTCLHEDASVAMAHGYALVAGKPMLVLLHGSIGVQHAAMAIQDAKASRAPVFLVAGNGARLHGAHNARDLARCVRQDLKWDDEPKSIDEFAASAMRTYKIATTPPAGPVLLVLDQLMQEAPFTRHHLELSVPVPTAPPQADAGAVQEVAGRLVCAQRPLIVALRAARTPVGMRQLAELAETVQAPVDSAGGLEIHNRHPLAGSGGCGYRPDLVLLLEADRIPAMVGAKWTEDAEWIAISASAPFLQDVSGGPEARWSIYGDAEATLPGLIEECRRRISGARKQALERRELEIAHRHRQERQRWLNEAAQCRDDGSIHMAHAVGELWPLIEHEDWSLVSCGGSAWPSRLWDFDKPYRYASGLDGWGRGGSAGVAIGAALAHRPAGRVSINFQSETALARSPGVLWTAAHHHIPLLTVALRTQGTGGSGLCFAQLGNSLGVASEGPVTRAQELVPAFRRGLERVKRGEPALVELVLGRDPEGP